MLSAQSMSDSRSEMEATAYTALISRVESLAAEVTQLKSQLQPEHKQQPSHVWNTDGVVGTSIADQVRSIAEQQQAMIDCNQWVQCQDQRTFYNAALRKYYDPVSQLYADEQGYRYRYDEKLHEYVPVDPHKEATTQSLGSQVPPPPSRQTSAVGESKAPNDGKRSSDQLAFLCRRLSRSNTRDASDPTLNQVARWSMCTSSPFAMYLRRDVKSRDEEMNMDRELAVIGTLCSLLDSICEDARSKRRDVSVDEKKRPSRETRYVEDSKRPKLTKLPKLTELVQEDCRANSQAPSTDVIEVLSSSDEDVERTPPHAQEEDDSDVEVVCVKESHKKKKGSRYVPPVNVDPQSRSLFSNDAVNGNQQSSTDTPMRSRQGGAFDEGNTSEEKDSDDLEEYDEDADNFSDEADEMEKQAKRLRRLEMRQARYPPCIRFMDPNGNVHIMTAVGGTIGRNSVNVIQLDGKSVSRQHCQIRYETNTGQFMIEDMGTRNGTYVNENRIEDPVVIRHGDVVVIGGVNGGVTLQTHIHQGNNTCSGCEPGIARAQAQVHVPPGTVTVDPIQDAMRKRTREGRRRAEEQVLKRQYGIGAFETSEQRTNFNEADMQPYRDRAAERRARRLGKKKHGPDFEPPVRQQRQGPVAPAIDRPLTSDNMGYKMLARMGWKEGARLGTGDDRNAGLAEPIAPIVRMGREGLGNEVIATKGWNEAWKEDMRRIRNIEKMRQRYNNAPLIDPQMFADRECMQLPQQFTSQQHESNPEPHIDYMQQSMTMHDIGPRVPKPSSHPHASFNLPDAAARAMRNPPRLPPPKQQAVHDGRPLMLDFSDDWSSVLASDNQESAK